MDSFLNSPKLLDSIGALVIPLAKQGLAEDYPALLINRVNAVVHLYEKSQKLPGLIFRTHSAESIKLIKELKMIINKNINLKEKQEAIQKAFRGTPINPGRLYNFLKENGLKDFVKLKEPESTSSFTIKKNK